MNAHDDFIATVCDGFVQALLARDADVMFSSQDVYEALSAVFGDTFDAAALRAATAAQCAQLALEIAALGKQTVGDGDTACVMLARALAQSGY